MRRRHWTEEGRKWEMIKICQKGKEQTITGERRKAGRDDSGRSLITVAKSKGKLNSEVGKMEECSLWESVANTGMDEMMRSTGTLECENMQNGDPQLKDTSPQGRMSRMEWGWGREHSKRADCQGGVQAKWTERIKTKELDHPWMKRRRNELRRRERCEEW